MPLCGAGCELDWREASEARVRSVGVVVNPPVFDQPAGLRQAGEQVLVEALIPEPTVERLNEAILHRLVRRDVVPFHLTLFLPGQDSVRGQLGAIVADDHAGMTAAADSPAWCSFKIPMICSSVNLLLRIACLLQGEQNPNPLPGAFQGSRS